MVSLPRLLLYLVWMWPLLHKLSGTPFASFFWALSCLRRLPYSQASMYLSFSHHFSALLLSRNIVRLLFVCLLSSRCAYRGLMIHVPKDRREAQQRMQAFVRFLEGLITSQQVKRAQLQPARVPFFQSIWWHIQAQERWPIFYGDVRRAILADAGATTSDPSEAYFSFCTRFLALAQE